MAENRFAKYATASDDPAPVNRFAKYATPAVEDAQPAAMPAPPAPPLDARAQAADAVVKKEGEDHPWGRAVDDTILNLLHGTVGGSFVDEASAGMSAAAHKVTGGRFGQPYDDAKAYEDARSRALDAKSKTLGNIPTPFGDLPVTTNGLTQLGGAIASAPLMGSIKVMQGASALPRLVNNVATGGLLGSIYGAGQEEGDGRVANAVRGLETGGALGGLLPPLANAVGKVAGNVTGGIVNAMGRTPQALKGFHPDAVKNISGAFERDAVQAGPSGTPLAQTPSGAPVDLGIEGMLADYGPALQAHASGLAARPDSMSTIIPAVERRAAGATGRIQNSINQSFGKALNVPETAEAVSRDANARAKPLYEIFDSAMIKPSERLYSILDAAESTGAYSKGIKALQRKELDPSDPAMTGRLLDQIKRALDGQAGTALRAGDREEAADLTKLAGQLRHEVDSILSPHDPSQSVWAKARGISERGFNINDAIESGRAAIKNRVHPDQMAYDMKGLSQVEQDGTMIGARDAYGTMIGERATAFGPKGDTAARQAFNSDFGRERANLVAQPGTAPQLHQRIAAENTMAETANEVLGNSRTALRTEVNKLYPNPNDKVVSPFHGAKGLMFHPVQKIFELATRGAVTERSIKISTDAAKMLVAQGADRDAIVQGLRTYLKNSNLGTKQRVAVTRVANTLAYGARTLAIQAPPQAQRGESRP